MKGETKVYRLERDGLGPFSQYIEKEVEYFAITCEDVKFKKGDNKRCFLYGCDSQASLVEYFGDDIFFKLLDVGFTLKEYDVPPRRIRKSPNNKQLAFHTGTTDTTLLLGVRKMMNDLN